MSKKYKKRITKEEIIEIKKEIKKAMESGEYLFEKRGEISHFHHVMENIKHKKMPHIFCLGKIIKKAKEELKKEKEDGISKNHDEDKILEIPKEESVQDNTDKEKPNVDTEEETPNVDTEEETPNDMGSQYRFEVENIRRGLKEFPIALSETEPYLKVQKWQQAFYIQHVYHIPVHEYDPINNIFLFKNTEKTREAHRKYHASDVKFLLAAFAVFRSQYYNPNYKR